MISSKLIIRTERKAVVTNFLKKNGMQTLQSLKEGFDRQSLTLPFAEFGDKVLESWLNTIKEIRKVNYDTTIKYIVKTPAELNHTDSDFSIVSDCPPQSERSSTPIDTVRQPTTSSIVESPEKESNPSWETSRTPSPVGLNISLPNMPEFKSLANGDEGFENDIPGVQAGKTTFPNFFSIPLIGDDNLLNFATYQLEFETTKENSIRTCGLCRSGLKISEVAMQISNINSEESDVVIINVGSTDIAEGRQLIEMIRDFDVMLNHCKLKGIRPILTTLAPLPNYTNGNRKRTLEGFNKVIRHFAPLYSVIDLERCMLHKNGQPNALYYQEAPRFISGSRRRIQMWNVLGRKRIYDMLLKNLGQVLVFSNFIGDYC